MARRRGRRGYRRPRYYSRSVGNRSIGGVSTKFLLGAVAGYLGLDDPVPSQFTLGLAVLPMKTGGIGTVAKGVVAGELIKALLGNKIGSSSAGGGV